MGKDIHCIRKGNDSEKPNQCKDSDVKAYLDNHSHECSCSREKSEEVESFNINEEYRNCREYPS